MIFQTTLKKEVKCYGLGLHSGKKVALTLSPSMEGKGIRFFRSDKKGEMIEARDEYVSHVNYATTLKKNGCSVTTVEHLLGAIYALGITNIDIYIDAGEIPIMDGSASPYLALLNEAGIKRLSQRVHYLKLIDSIFVGNKDKFVEARASDSFQINYTIEFDHPLIGTQQRSFVINKKIFREEISPARTFGFLKDAEIMRKNGLALGGSLNNAIILSENSILNNRLRFKDEFVRHKVLDLIGDLALLRHPILATITAYKAGHALHYQLVAEILKNPEKWVLVQGFRLPSGKISFGQNLPIPSPALEK